VRILGIGGSPRAGGNSDFLLETALEAALAAGAEVERLHVRDLVVAPCRECDRCREGQPCELPADGAQRFFEALDRCPVVMLGTPVFFYGPPAPLKALIDRAQARYHARRALRAAPSAGAAFVLAAGGSRRPDTFAGLELTLKEWFFALGRELVEMRGFGGLEGLDAARASAEIRLAARGVGERAARWDGGQARGRAHPTM